MVLDGYARNVSTVADAPLVVEPSAHSSLPGGLLLCSYVLTSPRRTSFKVPIIIQNETSHEITLPANCCLAELYTPSTVSSLRSTSTKERGPTTVFSTTKVGCNAVCSADSKHKISFDFTESPLSEEWKDRITAKLNSIPEVFATSELDYGHTTSVKHRIRLSDPTPFKQRVRPIHPSDFEAVRFPILRSLKRCKYHP
ncbi:hypothetical protein QQF64_018331 [Cirrhinus molitorella]|uniref:Uncharacterized protein n=1 Tax=Cirrhinus molitorella TaxID=172907 RepID=A0ABR3LC93_9TELE